MFASSIYFLSSISTLITNECFSNIKNRFTKLRDWIIVFSVFYEKDLNESLVVEKIEEKEALELKKNYVLYPDRRKEIMTSTQFKVQDIFGANINKDTISQDRIIKSNNFSVKMM